MNFQFVKTSEKYYIFNVSNFKTKTYPRPLLSKPPFRLYKRENIKEPVAMLLSKDMKIS
jgi:hypothetical protein